MLSEMDSKSTQPRWVPPGVVMTVFLWLDLAVYTASLKANEDSEESSIKPAGRLIRRRIRFSHTSKLPRPETMRPIMKGVPSIVATSACRATVLELAKTFRKVLLNLSGGRSVPFALLWREGVLFDEV